MAHHELSMPIDEAQVRALRVDDTVTLQRTLYGIRDATQIHLFDRGRTTRFDLHGHAVIHTAPNVKAVEKSAQHPAGYAPICIGTTTSDRMERFTRPLMAQHGVRLIIGKGGLREASLAAFARARRRLPGDRRRHRRARDHLDRADRGRRPRRPESRVALEIPHPRFRPAAGRDGQPRRQPVRRRQRQRQGAPRGGARRPRGPAVTAPALRRLSTDILILGSGGAGLFAALHAHQAAPRSLDHGGGEGPARQVRLHAHGPGRLQRRARRRRFDRAPLHGHDRRQQVARRPGPRLDAGDDARSSASTSSRTSSAASSTAIPTAPCTRRRSPARPSTAPCTRATSPASRSSTASPSRSGRAASAGSRSTAPSSSSRPQTAARSPAC